jgi:cobalt-zinc-cadmium efflux system outer membrane protein
VTPSALRGPDIGGAAPRGSLLRRGRRGTRRRRLLRGWRQLRQEYSSEDRGGGDQGSHTHILREPVQTARLKTAGTAAIDLQIDPARAFAIRLSRMFARSAAAVVCLVLVLPPAAGAQPSDLPTPLTFDAARSYAETHNLAVDAARRGRAIREAAIRAAGQRPNPAFDAEASRDTPHQTLTFEFPIEIGSQRSRRIDVANGELLLADIDVQAGMRIVRRQLREQFFGLLAADERVRLAESVVEIATRVRDAAQARFDAGAVPRLEVMQADLGVSRAEAEHEAARSERAAAQATLNGVLNAPPQQALALQGSLADHTASPPFSEATLIAATSNTDLVGLDRQIDIEARRLELLRAQRTPVPTFSIAALFNAPGDYGVAPAASVNVGLPIFSRNQGEIAASIATTSQLRGQREAIRRTVENAVYAATARVEAARQQVQTFQQRLIPVATELESLSEESYRAGRTSVLGVLDAQRSLRDLSRDAVQASLDLQMALAELEDLLGTPLP